MQDNKTFRGVRRVVQGIPAVDGAGVHLVRVVGSDDVEDFDPFLMFDAFDSTDPDDYIAGFPFHPHRGMETVTYLIEGDIEHKDSLGNSGSIRDGDCQWMTAGSGIIHQEMPQPSPRLLGAQLWLNLPAADKMCTPAYGDIRHEDIPVVEDAAATVRVVGGSHAGHDGSFQGQHVRANYLDVTVAPDSTWEYASDPEATLFAYIVNGAASFEEGGELLGDHQAVLFGAGDALRVETSGQGMRMLLIEGRPLREPVAWGGPIVMNTTEELRRAFSELEDGTFIKA